MVAVKIIAVLPEDTVLPEPTAFMALFHPARKSFASGLFWTAAWDYLMDPCHADVCLTIHSASDPRSYITARMRIQQMGSEGLPPTELIERMETRDGSLGVGHVEDSARTVSRQVPVAVSEDGKLSSSSSFESTTAASGSDGATCRCIIGHKEDVAASEVDDSLDLHGTRFGMEERFSPDRRNRRSTSWY